MYACRANAKLNLFLRVTGRRSDGFHDIETVFHTVALADDMEFENAASGHIVAEMVFEDGPVLRADENLAIKAARLLAESIGRGGASIRIVKRIPVGSGLAGGSADAAAALVALNRLWDARLTASELAALGAEVGSDVPYLISGGTALATGRGERLEAVGGPRMWFVLGMSHRSLATADVYAAWDRSGGTYEHGARRMLDALRAGDVGGVAEALRNDLFLPAVRLRPELARGPAIMLGAGALGACMSGSGPTVFAIASGEAHARAVATAVGGAFDSVVVVSSAGSCIEPVSLRG